jgi:hypothetical protein
MRLVDLLRYYAGKLPAPSSGGSEPPVSRNRQTKYKSQCEVEIDLPVAIDDWPQEYREAYEEKAAVMEFEAGMDRTVAEKRSEELQRKAFRCRISVTATSKNQLAE